MISGSDITGLPHMEKKIVTDTHLFNVETFLEKYSDYATAVEERYKIPAIAMLAQAAIETGWGALILMVWCNSVRICSNNLFNVKVHYDEKNGVLVPDWNGRKGTARVNEFVNGVEHTNQLDYFRVYPSAKESFYDYADYIMTRQKPDGTLRYERAFGIKEPDQYIDAISSAGYATDPTYAREIKQIIKMLHYND